MLLANSAFILEVPTVVHYSTSMYNLSDHEHLLTQCAINCSKSINAK